MIDLILAVIVDFIIGDPENFPHPVRLFGKLISTEEKHIRKIVSSNRGLYIGGLFVVIINMLFAFFIPFAVLKLLKPYSILYHIVNIYLLYSCIAAKCLRDEGIKIYKALEVSIEEARYKLSFIVGRDTKELNESEIIRATVETVAENTSDGVIAPLLFAMVLGAPAAILYKMVNTMDSMLGYLNEKYRYIGYFPAKTDDVFNFIPARLTGILMNMSSIFRFRASSGFLIMFRDRKNHKSPNCAYPEGAVAGLLGIELGGSNSYFGEIMVKPKIGDAIKKIDKENIKNAIEIMFRAELLILFIYTFIKLIQ